jgi:hypothetical protein
LEFLSLVTELNNMENAKSVHRQRVAKFVLKDPNLFKHLIAITFDVDNKVSIKAAARRNHNSGYKKFRKEK